MFTSVTKLLEPVFFIVLVCQAGNNAAKSSLTKELPGRLFASCPFTWKYAEDKE